MCYRENIQISMGPLLPFCFNKTHKTWIKCIVIVEQYCECVWNSEVLKLFLYLLSNELQNKIAVVIQCAADFKSVLPSDS